MTKKGIVLLSGGLDSSVLLGRLVRTGVHAKPLSVLYGQRHAREVEAAKRVTEALGVRGLHRVIELEGLRPYLGGSALTDDSVPVPHGHYAAESMRATVVPNRNMMLLAIATAVAVGAGCSEVYYAAHAGDHAIYPDCRPEFFQAAALAAYLGNDPPVQLVAPFITWTKDKIVAEASRLNLLEVAGLSWSCYEGGAAHCGRCGTCVERREAFEIAGVADPTDYAAPSPEEESMP